MRLPCKTKIEKAWLVTSLLIMFLHRMLESFPPNYDSPAIMVRLWLEVAMIVLSFPFGGLSIFFIKNATFWCDDCRSLEWMLDWSTLLLAGYIQWFWIMPQILRDRKLTFLNLRQPEEVVLLEVSPLTSNAPQVAASTTEESFTFPPAEFDEAGLTALERVLRAPQTSTPAP